MTSLDTVASKSPSEPVPSSVDARNQSRRYGLRDGAYQAIAQGSGEQYLSAFAVLLHASPIQLSLLSALPQMFGTGAQLVSVKFASRFPDRKSLLMAGTMGQAVAWLPILCLPLLFPDYGSWLLIAGTALYFACNQFTTPTWNSFITDHLDQHERGAYFARRAKIMAGISFVTLCLAGWLLTWWQHSALGWIGFALVFALAGSARALSATTLSRLTSIAPESRPNVSRSFRHFLRTTEPSFRRFLIFSGSMHAAVLIAGPFFVVYLLRDLHWSYLTYGAWMGAGILGQLVTLRAWGEFGDRFGNKALLAVTSLLVPFLPMLYLFGTNVAFLITVNFLGGIIWGGLALGLQNYVFDTVGPADRAKAVATYSAVNALGWCTGALIGTGLVAALPSQVTLANYSLQLASNLPVVFLVSGILRLAVSGSLLGSFHEARIAERAKFQQLVRELPLCKPIVQAVLEPLARRYGRMA